MRVGGFDIKRFIVDQGSRVEIMYPDLYRGLGLKPEDLDKYDSLLIGFNGRTMVPRGMIKLPVQIGDEVVEVSFVVVNAYSLYTAILAWP